MGRSGPQRSASRKRGEERMVVLRPSGVPAPPFTPLSIPGLVAWYDFSDPTSLYTDAGATLVSADGQAIYQANDKSGNGNHLTQAAGANRPLYKVNVLNGKAGALFPGVNGVSGANLASASMGTKSQPNSMFLVGQRVTLSANDNIWTDAIAASPNRGLLFEDGGASAYRLVNGGIQIVPGSDPDTNAHTFTVIYNGAGSKLYIDGALDITGDAGSEAFTGVTLGSVQGAPTAGPLNGYVFEIVLLNALVSTANHNLVGTNLSAKYAQGWTTVT
jgi:hypothetical protein